MRHVVVAPLLLGAGEQQRLGRRADATVRQVHAVGPNRVPRLMEHVQPPVQLARSDVQP